jgi:hypothetical protein
VRLTAIYFTRLAEGLLLEADCNKLHETSLGLAPRDGLHFTSRDWLRACSARLTAIFFTRLAEGLLRETDCNLLYETG